MDSINDEPKNSGRRKFIRSAAAAVAGLTVLKAGALPVIQNVRGLKDLFQEDFNIGVALGSRLFMQENIDLPEIITREFNSITMENAMKWRNIHPAENEWRFELPDRFVDFGNRNKMQMVGHVLVWHSQVPNEIFLDNKGKRVNRDILLKRMENHIQTLVDRYKGKIHVWDVVNESITPEDGWRKSPWLEIIGPEFMERAFHLAHEADPECHLLYNDYGMDNSKRRDYVVEMVKDFRRRGIPIHGIGMQGHYHLDVPRIEAIEASIDAFAGTGLPVHFTELDVDVLPRNWKPTAEISEDKEYEKSMNPFVEGLPKEVNDQLTRRYEELFRLFLKHRNQIERVTFWGTSDADSWKNNFPVRGRTNYPLLFDRRQEPKDAYYAVAALKS